MIKTLLLTALIQVSVATEPVIINHFPLYANRGKELYYNSKLKFFYFV